MKLKISLILLGPLIVGCSQKKTDHEDYHDMLTQQEIVGIATEVAVDLELPMEYITPYYDVNNVQWGDFCVNLQKEDSKDYKWAKKKLKNRFYQAVRLRPEPGKVLDGSFWVLVDKKTGEVIMSIQDL